MLKGLVVHSSFVSCSSSGFVRCPVAPGGSYVHRLLPATYMHCCDRRLALQGTEPAQMPSKLLWSLKRLFRSRRSLGTLRHLCWDAHRWSSASKTQQLCYR